MVTTFFFTSLHACMVECNSKSQKERKKVTTVSCTGMMVRLWQSRLPMMANIGMLIAGLVYAVPPSINASGPANGEIRILPRLYQITTLPCDVPMAVSQADMHMHQLTGCCDIKVCSSSACHI